MVKLFETFLELLPCRFLFLQNLNGRSLLYYCFPNLICPSKKIDNVSLYMSDYCLTFHFPDLCCECHTRTYSSAQERTDHSQIQENPHLQVSCYFNLFGTSAELNDLHEQTNYVANVAFLLFWGIKILIFNLNPNKRQ